MKNANESYTESNNTAYIKDDNNNNKNSLGLFPLLNFNENLYNICKSKYSTFLNNRKNDIKLIINNKLNQHISLEDYISNSNFNELTPIPIINKRKIKNIEEKKELNKFQRNAVLMRRLEYTNQMKQKKLKQKYNNKISKIIYLQKVIRGYLVRKVIKQVNIIKNTLDNFCFLISLCIQKKYYYILKNKIIEIKKINKNINNNFLNGNSNVNININGCEEKTIKNNDIYNNIVKQIKNKENGDIKNDNYIDMNNINNNTSKDNMNNTKNQCEENINYNNNKPKNKRNSFNNNIDNNKNIKESKNELINKIENNINYNINNSKTEKSKNNKNIQFNKNNQDSIIENDYYIDFSCKDSHKTEKKSKNKSNNSSKNKSNNNSKKNIPNRNPKNDILKYYLSDISSNLEIKKTKTETIQRVFRKYLSKKGYYGKFDKRKIAIIYLLKNMIIYNIRPYILNIIKLNYKQIKNITMTQEENFYNLASERAYNVNNNYQAAKNELI